MRLLSLSVQGFLTVAILYSQSAYADRFDTYRLDQRLTEMEKQLEYLREQNFAQPIPANPGSTTAKLGRLEESMRELRGDIEQTQYQIRTLQEKFDNFQADIDFRFQELGRQAPAQGAPAAAYPQRGGAVANPYAGPVEAPQPLIQAPSANVDDEAILKVPDPEDDTPRSLYNRAFRLLNQTDYQGAEEQFRIFTQRYANDPLIGNAWYWLGETFYVRRDYVRAADSFRQGFEKLPEGPKAGDNLLKLALSLSALQKVQEACIVLRQVEEKYARQAENLRMRAQKEMNRLNCAAN
jgi:tol-pal system protein YbgF